MCSQPGAPPNALQTSQKQKCSGLEAQRICNATKKKTPLTRIWHITKLLKLSCIFCRNSLDLLHCSPPELLISQPKLLLSCHLLLETHPPDWKSVSAAFVLALRKQQVYQKKHCAAWQNKSPQGPSVLKRSRALSVLTPSVREAAQGQGSSLYIL